MIKVIFSLITLHINVSSQPVPPTGGSVVSEMHGSMSQKSAAFQGAIKFNIHVLNYYFQFLKAKKGNKAEIK